MMRLASLAVCATALQAPVRRKRITRLQIAPSGVDGLPVPLQAVVFLGCAGGIGPACGCGRSCCGGGAEKRSAFVTLRLDILGSAAGAEPPRGTAHGA